MKIVYIAKSLAPIGGLERVLSDKMNYLVTKDYDVTLVTYEQGKHPFAFHLDDRIHHYDLHVVFFALHRYGFLKRVLLQQYYRILFKKRLQKLITETKPDVIITTTYSMIVVDKIANLRTSAFKIIESHVAYHVMRKQDSYRPNTILHYIARFIDQFTIKAVGKFDLLVTLTKSDAEEWSKHISRMAVIPNPITKYPETVTHSQDTKCRIICAGRLDGQKGFDMLIDAFALIADQCPQWHIDIFGSGEEKEKLMYQIKANGLFGRIVINNPTDDIYHEYSSSDFFVLSSRFEGFGLVLAEAMSCAIPCVSFNCPYGPEEIITDTVDGLLAKACEVKDLADKMLWMIIHEEERKKMGIRAREKARRYQMDTVMRQWTTLLESVK